MKISVASMADKTRGRMRILSYGDANRHRRDLLELATAGFMRLVQVITMVKMAAMVRMKVGMAILAMMMMTLMVMIMIGMMTIVMKMAVIISLLEFNRLTRKQTKFPRNC